MWEQGEHENGAQIALVISEEFCEHSVSHVFVISDSKDKCSYGQNG